MKTKKKSYRKTARQSIKKIKKITYHINHYPFKQEMEIVDQLKQTTNLLLSSIKRKEKDCINVILYNFSSEINEILHLFLTLKDLKIYKIKTDRIEQITINRASYIFETMIKEMGLEEELNKK